MRHRERCAERRSANAAFYAGNVGLAIEDLRARGGDPDVVVVDPPRAGLAGKALKRLGETAAPRIVYVSCNPTTLAGDVKVLREQYGYELKRVKPVDMFPHTPHVEAVALPGRAAPTRRRVRGPCLFEHAPSGSSWTMEAGSSG